jgi:RimJ/RimL family protein N-acetyltransferase
VPRSRIVLETGRLILRDHRAEDLDAWCAVEADPEVRRFVGGAPRPPADARRRFRERFLRPRRRGLGLWAAVLKSSGAYVGYAGVYPRFETMGRAIAGEGSLGFTLAREYWGRGLGTEAAAALARHAFGELGLRRLVASVEAGNAASVRILEKLGFRLWRLERVGKRCLYHLELDHPGRAVEAPAGRDAAGE